MGSEVCFLFTDLVGSTSSWEREPDRMAAAVERHDRLIEAAVSRNDGQIFKWTGDGCCAAFGDTQQAIRAAFEIRKAIETAEWDLIRGLSIRVALHRGPAQRRGADYFGPSLNRLARLLELCEGGQILASGSVVTAKDRPLRAVAARPLGECRLRDVATPVDVYALESDRSVSHGVETPLGRPAQSSPGFIGRSREVEEVTRLIRRGHRVVTVTGLSGIGKTQLAMEVARGAGFFDTERVVDCGSLTGSRIASEIGEMPDRSLVVLDGFDHLVNDETAIAALADVRRGSVLVTSCRRLATDYETVYLLGGLATQFASGNSPRSEAEDFFYDRALRTSGVRVTPDDERITRQIVALVDGHPLALEMAASWLHSRSTSELLEWMRLEPTSLATRLRGMPPHHASLRAIFETSVSPLDEAANLLLDNISVFAGSFSTEALRRTLVWDAGRLSDLLDCSLVLRRGPDRWEIQRIIRPFAQERTDPAPWRQYRRRHLEYHRYLATDLNHQLSSPKRTEALASLGEGFADWEAAWHFAIARSDVAALGEMARPLSDVCEARAWFSQAESLFEAALPAVDATPDPARQEVRLALGRTRFRQGRLDHASELANRVIDDDPLEHQAARAFALLGSVAYRGARIADARRNWTKALESIHRYGDPVTEASLLNNLALLDMEENEHGAAIERLERATGLFEGLDDQRGRANCEHNLGWARRLTGRLELARLHLEDALSTAEACGDLRTQAQALHQLASIAIAQGRYGDARAMATASLETMDAIGLHGMRWRPMIVLAQVEEVTGGFPEARRLALAVLEGTDASEDPWAKYFSHLLLGDVYLDLRATEQAQRHYEETLSLASSIGATPDAQRTTDLARVALADGQLAEAEALASRALEEARQVDDAWAGARAHLVLAQTFARAGDTVPARSHLQVGVQWALTERAMPHLLDGVLIGAEIALAESDTRRASALARHAEAHPRSTAGIRRDAAEIPVVDGAPAVTGSVEQVLAEITSTEANDVVSGRAPRRDEHPR